MVKLYPLFPEEEHYYPLIIISVWLLEFLGEMFPVKFSSHRYFINNDNTKIDLFCEKTYTVKEESPGLTRETCSLHRDNSKLTVLQ